MSNVRGYTDEEILEKVKSLPSFKYIPENYWVVGIQSNEDAFNEFDDKFYMYKGEKFISVMTGTTNAGKNALKNYDKQGLFGAAVWKTNEIYYDLYSPGKHRGRMDAWRQVKPIKYFRDNDKDDKAEQEGKQYYGIIYANFHNSTYDTNSRAIKKLINGWSWGCQVSNDHKKYQTWMNKTKAQLFISYCLLDEF